MNNSTGITGGQGAPVWASIYPGRFQDIIEVDNKPFFFGKSCDNNQNAIYGFVEDCGNDWHPDVQRPIRSRVYTKEFTFESQIQDKVIRWVHMDVRNIVGKFQAEIFYRIEGECEWKFFGNICYDIDECCRRTSMRNEFVCHNSDEEAKFKSIQFRIDIQGSKYEIINFFALADLCTELQPQRKFDADETFAGFSDLGDNELCH